MAEHQLVNAAVAQASGGDRSYFDIAPESGRLK
jgi:hypothetical protein